MKIYRLLFLSLFALVSCKKEVTRIETYKPTPLFRINGLRGHTFLHNPFGTYAATEYQLHLKYESGTPQLITLSVEDRSGFLRTSMKDTSGYPDFESTLYVEDAPGPAGIYTLNLVAKSDGMPDKKFPFQVTVAGDTNCSGFFVNQRYVGISYCPQQEYHFAVQASVLSGNNDTLLYENLFPGVSLKVIPDCKSETLNIPIQNVGNVTYSGTGTTSTEAYTASVSIKLNLKIQRPGNLPQDCIYVLQSQ